VSQAVQIESRAVGVDPSERFVRSGRVGLAVTAAFSFLCAALSGFVREFPEWPWMLVYLGGVGSLLGLAAGISRRAPRTAPAKVTIEDGVLTVDPGSIRAPLATIRVPVDELVQGWEEPGEVHFATRDGRVIVVALGGAGDGERLLRAAGVSAERRALRVPLSTAAERAPGGAGVVGLLAGGLAMGAAAQLSELARSLVAGVEHLGRTGFGASVGLLLATMLAAWVLSLSFRRREVVVGTDGLFVRRALGRELLRYADVDKVIPDTRGVVIQKKNGKKVLLPTRGAEESPLRAVLPAPGDPVTDAEARRGALLARIHQAMNASAEGAEVWASLDQLDRKGRAFSAWREDLSRVLAHMTDYRTVGLGPSDLARVIVDPQATAERRIAATVALSAAQPEEARVRARIAADACADEALRRALQRAAEGEIDEELLAEDEARAPRLRR
jgi:hypothetical protein